MQPNIGCCDVCNKLIPLLCVNCDRILGASFTNNADSTNSTNSTWYCRACLTDIGNVADTIAVITEQDPGQYCSPTGLPNVFSMLDVSNFFDKYLISPKPTDPLKVLHWCDEQREELTKKKTNQFLKRV